MEKNFFLATTALEKTWDNSAEKIVFLGTQCKLYSKRDKYKNDKYIDMPTLWNSQVKIEDAANKCKIIFNKKLSQITKVYNEIFDIYENELYYNRIFGYWLIDFINKIYDVYYSIKYAFEIYPNIYTSVLNKNKYIIPNNYQDYASKSIDDEYAFQLYSHVVESFNLKNNIEVLLDIKKEQKISKNKISLKEKVLRYTSNFLNNIFQHKKIIITSPYFSKQRIKTYLNLLYKSKFKIVFDNMNYDVDSIEEDVLDRDLLYSQLKLFEKDEFDKVLNKLIALNIPKIYFEKFSPIRKIVSKDTNRDADIYFTANAHYGNEYFKYKVASKSSSKYLIMQHGGGHGLFKLNFGEYWETQVADIFYSFGWSNKSNVKYLAPSKFIGDVDNYHYHNSGDILYITNTISRYLRHFNGYGYFGDSSEKLFIDKRESFLKKINPNIDIKLRMYPKDHYKLFEKQRIENKQLKNIIFDDDKKDFINSLLNCKLHITDITMTTFLEALVYNIPTVCFTPILEYNIADISQEAIKKLVNAKILFFDEVKAAEHINNIYLDIEGWWNQATVQKAKDDYINKFAKKSETLENDWVNEFDLILEKGK